MTIFNKMHNVETVPDDWEKERLYQSTKVSKNLVNLYSTLGVLAVQK